MRLRLLASARSVLPLLLAIGMSVAVLALSLYNLRAVREWRLSSTALVDRAAFDAAQLVATALTRDMRGVQMLVLANRDAGDFSAQEADVSNQVATAFTRFPYPESFFVWRTGEPAPVFFNRGNRPPAWLAGEHDGAPYPVSVARDAPFAAALLEQLQRAGRARSSYTYLQSAIVGSPYQMVARLEYSNPFRDELIGATGFTVNLAWARSRYFPEIMAQLARISQTPNTLDYVILDETGRAVVGQLPYEPMTTFDLPLQFFDPWTMLAEGPGGNATDIWKVGVSAANDPTVLWATREADWTLVLITVAALTLTASFFLMARGVQASASLATMRSDFVAAVTHDLKTPLATIRVVANTLQRQTLPAPAIRKYAGTLVEENRRLSRLVDNMLAYARVTDVTEVYSFERLCLPELVDDALGGFQQQLTAGSFEVDVNMEDDLPWIRADRTALRLALDNLIDNAIRYSNERRSLAIAARRDGDHVIVDVRDQGVGIPSGEVATVQRKFVRGTRARNSGTGLGLAIVHRVALDHRGRFEMESTLGVGTTARLVLPIARGQ